MAGRWRWLTAMLGLALAAAIPAQDGPRVLFQVPDNDPLRFAYQLFEFANCIQQQYVHPVGRTDLLEAALTGLCEAAGETPPDGLREELDRDTLTELLRYIEQLRKKLGDHPAIAGPKAMLVCAKSVVKVLDPYCGIVEPNYRALAVDSEGNPFGAGVEFANAPPAFTQELPVRPRLAPGPTVKLGAPLQVQNVVAGSPGQRAGLRPGDRVIRIDGQPTAETNSAVFETVFHTGDVQAHTITIDRPGRNASPTVNLAPETYIPEGVFGVRRLSDGQWDFQLDRANKLGYLRVGAIENKTAQQFLDALYHLRDDGAHGMILDLRWCPGGYLEVAIEIAKGLLRHDLPIAAKKDRTGVKPEDATPDGPPVLDLPVVVLINGSTSGGGELIAAALQDHRRAIIAGDRTVGKASVQQSLDRSPLEGVRFKISTALLIRPSGKNLQRRADSRPADDWGVRPDPGHWLPLSPAVANQLKEWWTWHTLRPAGDNSALLTDDPEVDPQLKAALQMLRAHIRRGG